MFRFLLCGCLVSRFLEFLLEFDHDLAFGILVGYQ